MTIRQLKNEILGLLSRGDFHHSIKEFPGLPERQAINPLFSFLYHQDEIIRWHAVSAMGVVVSSMAETDLESARVVMRRLIWNLNDESGGIGWGSPEAMGEIMACHPPLAKEFSKILVSYIIPGGTFIEHEVLQRGVLWGLTRLAGTRPGLKIQVGSFILPFFESKDPYHRGLAARFCGTVNSKDAVPFLERLCHDKTLIILYTGFQLVPYTVGDLAASAITDIR